MDTLCSNHILQKAATIKTAFGSYCLAFACNANYPQYMTYLVNQFVINGSKLCACNTTFPNAITLQRAAITLSSWQLPFLP